MTSGLLPTACPSAAAKLAMGPAARPAVVGLDDQLGRGAPVGEREQQPGEIVDVEQRKAARRRHEHQAALGHLEQFERFAVAGAVDRGRADDRPVEAAGLRPAPPRAPSTRRTSTSPGSRAASEETWTKRWTPPAVAAASIASVPVTLACVERRLVGRVEHARRHG